MATFSFSEIWRNYKSENIFNKALLLNTKKFPPFNQLCYKVLRKHKI